LAVAVFEETFMSRSGTAVLSVLLAAAVTITLPVLSDLQSHAMFLVVQALLMPCWWFFWARRRRVAHKAWLVALAGCSITVATDLVRFGVDHLGLAPQAAPVAQLVECVGLALMTAAGLMFCFNRMERGRRALLLDTGVFTVGLATPLFAIWVVPVATSGLDRISVIGYATVSLVSLAVCTRFVMTWQSVRAPWLLWLAGAALANGVGCLLAADAPTSDPLLAVCRGLWVLAYGLGFTAMVTATPLRRDRPPRVAVERPSPGWVAVLVLSIAMPGVTLAIAQSVGRVVSLPAIAAGSVALAVLVSARMATLVAHLHGQSLTLSEVAVRDELTGIPNRRGWNHALAQACRLAEWDNRPFSLAVLDLDHFKTYNDTHGHQAGDALLAATAHTWRHLLPPDAVLARYGGEEFTLILFDHDIATATHTLDALRTAMTHHQTFSAGLTLWRPGIPAELLFTEADQALYHAKHLGRDRFELAVGASTPVATPARAANPGMPAPTDARIAVASAVDRRGGVERFTVRSVERRTRRDAARTRATSDVAS
jgi:diguanylate cyclase (GGDEF)-like protein